MRPGIDPVSPDDLPPPLPAADPTATDPRSPLGTPTLPAEPAQLPLPLPELPPSSQSWTVPRENRVYVNRNLRLSDVDWLGFDMDYTLAIYQQSEMDRIQIEATLAGLVRRGYPEFVLHVPYDTGFPIRGLVIDKKHGNVLKMDCHKVVHKAWHGLRELPRESVVELYHQRKIRLTAARYHWVDTLYALAEVTLYAALIEAFEQRQLPVDPDKLFTDIRQSIDEAHRNGSILETVAADFPRFVLRDPDLAQTLHRWRSAGKKLFLLTNSRLSYTQGMMTYLLGGAMPEYPSWRQFFDVIVVAAGKPGFFEERRPLLEHDGDNLRPAGATFERGKVYEGGNLHDFERMLGVTGDRILYVGDHIYGDILRSKKDSSWRTAMIIQEMAHEIRAYSECQGHIELLSDLEEQRQKTEDELRYLQLKYKQLSRQIELFSPIEQGLVPGQVLEAERTRIKRRLEAARGAMRSLETRINQLENHIDRRFHRYWGSLLKEGNETSSFGDQVEEYACLYTAKVSNFLAYSPLQHYRSPRDRMPHEL
ncbi:MAG: HAD-IG family 5'-nucleotidase [Polyangiaceae bacterium]|nr:HAD-IG family 5'-nucleotidase [Polyangiaceae bacterium]